MKSMLARMPPPSPRRSWRWLRTLASNHPSLVLILTWLPTWPASAIEGSSSPMHSFKRCKSSAICEPDPAISRTTPIGWLALSTALDRPAGARAATAPGSSAGLNVLNGWLAMSVMRDCSLGCVGFAVGNRGYDRAIDCARQNELRPPPLEYSLPEN